MTDMKTVLIRADAGPEIGIGHIMRCLALAQGCHDCGIKPFFVSNALSANLRIRLESEGLEVISPDATTGSEEDTRATIDLAQQRKTEWIVIDGYSFDSNYHRRIKEASFKLLTIHDLPCAQECWADLIINSTPQAQAALYPHRHAHTKLLLGTDYILLRREFRRRRPNRLSTPPSTRRLLITLGGSDSKNATAMILKMIEHASLPPLEIRVVLGPENRHLQSLAQRSTLGTHRLWVEQNVSDMSELMFWADAAISAAGSTCWELAYMGVPMAMVITADNQVPIVEALQNAGAGISLGWFSKLNPDHVASILTDQLLNPKQQDMMRLAGMKLVDGNGVFRVMAAMGLPTTPRLTIGR